ncbi:proline-rich nuclear receptor coactivator motif-containing protein [Sandaracinobacteroides hominis]|uniref:proline-rich nuclear receptor coactivator motif-containing protein n=1 Tax=Sandaracinobacteroides hominis TaxID=2780086 RepID=UPI0018F4E296|nr:proline-rich nuclear receptor coactivator motif-containing protein [Sandaracinobacteroides hominis]
MASGEAVADGAVDVAEARTMRPQRPGEGETILWQGRPAMLVRKLWELVGFLLLLGLLSWLALALIEPHFAGSSFAGSPNASALPLVLAMVAGMVLIIALPVWLRSNGRARARYMLTNRRALVWIGDRIAGEALLFGAEMQADATEVRFETPGLWLSWRLKDEGADMLRFEQIGEALAVAALAEEHGARWVNRPAEDQDDANAPA